MSAYLPGSELEFYSGWATSRLAGLPIPSHVAVLVLGLELAPVVLVVALQVVSMLGLAVGPVIVMGELVVGPVMVMGPVEVRGAGLVVSGSGAAVLGSGVEVLGAGPARRVASSPPYLVPPPSPQHQLG